MSVDILTEESIENADSAEKFNQAASRYAGMLKAAGDPLRLQILSVLNSDSFGVLELCQIFDTKQSGMSHHLKVLALADIVSTRREGNTKFYRRSDTTLEPSLTQLRRAVFKTAEDLALAPQTVVRLNEVYHQREETSRMFFKTNSAAFKKQQELIADYAVYGPEVDKLLSISQLPGKYTALEIGPGVGEYLNRLSEKFEQVIALDNSESMLEQSRNHCKKLGLDNIDFVCDDTSQCHQWLERFDCAVINMVLHHTPSPQQIFQDVATSLKQDAVLLVCDLGAHSQDWVREACGDQWLGFNVEELERWARNARLKLGESRYLSLRNGFQIQIHQFIKQ